jgi:hypothetical protein
MKRIFVTLLAAVGLTGSLAVPLTAQSTPAQAKIPFSFVVSNQTLPAGTYAISRVTPVAPVFVLRGEGSSVVVNFSQNEDGKPQNPSLTFVCYGNECVLDKIAPPDSTTAYSLSPAALEKNLPHKLGMASMISIKMTGR